MTTEELDNIHSFCKDSSPTTTIQTNVFDGNPQSPFVLCMYICNDFRLNQMQRVAFLIIANAWLKLYIEQKSQECSLLSNDNRSKYNQLRMFITGPGGTGKTHVIGGLTKLMVSYNSEHRI